MGVDVSATEALRSSRFSATQKRNELRTIPSRKDLELSIDHHFSKFQITAHLKQFHLSSLVLIGQKCPIGYFWANGHCLSIFLDKSSKMNPKGLILTRNVRNPSKARTRY